MASPLQNWMMVLGSGLLAAGVALVPAVANQDDGDAIALPFTPGVDETGYIPEIRARSDQPIDGPIRAIINDDDRRPVMSRNYPWSAIGRVDWVNPDGTVEGACTGTLIGLDLVLTNAHCLVDEITNQPTTKTIVFRPNMIQGRTAQDATVIDYVYGDSPYTGRAADDWAILKLDQPLGETYGYLGWRAVDFSDPNVRAGVGDRIRLVGYSGDFPTEYLSGFGEPGETAGVSARCAVLLIVPEGDLAETLVHSCDTNPGASGGPIFALFDDGEYYLVGLHSGSISLLESITLPTGESTDVLNRGVQVSRWAAQAAALRSR